MAASIPLEQDYHYWDATRTLPLPSHQTHKSTLSPTTVSALKASLADLNSGSVNSHSLLSMKMELHFPLDLYTIPMAHLPMANSYVYDPQVKFELSYLPTATQACFFAFTLLCPDLSLKCIFLMGIGSRFRSFRPVHILTSGLRPKEHRIASFDFQAYLSRITSS